MAGDFTGQNITAVMVIPNAFTTGNGQAAWKAFCDCKLVAAQFALETLGGSSGDTDIMLRNDTDTVDLLSTAALIDYDEDPAVVEGSLTTTASYLLIDDGDVIEVDIDGVCGGAAEAGLVVSLQLIGM
jgi:hypothetical protein